MVVDQAQLGQWFFKVISGHIKWHAFFAYNSLQKRENGSDGLNVLVKTHRLMCILTFFGHHLTPNNWTEVTWYQNLFLIFHGQQIHASREKKTTTFELLLQYSLFLSYSPKIAWRFEVVDLTASVKSRHNVLKTNTFRFVLWRTAPSLSRKGPAQLGVKRLVVQPTPPPTVRGGRKEPHKDEG